MTCSVGYKYDIIRFFLIIETYPDNQFVPKSLITDMLRNSAWPGQLYTMYVPRVIASIGLTISLQLHCVNTYFSGFDGFVKMNDLSACIMCIPVETAYIYLN